MTTPRILIKDALKKINVLGEGESPSYEMENDAFRELNRMLGQWSNKNLLVYGIQFEEFSLVAGQNTYTIGSGGDFNTTAPREITKMFIRYSGNNESEMNKLDSNQWGRVSDKTTQSSMPHSWYADMNYPLRNIYIYPTPSEVKTVILHNYRQFSAFSTLTETISMPPGYEETLLYNLARRIAPDYEKEASATVVKYAEDGLADLKRKNKTENIVRFDSAITNGNHSFDINTGGFR